MLCLRGLASKVKVVLKISTRLCGVGQDGVQATWANSANETSAFLLSPAAQNASKLSHSVMEYQHVVCGCVLGIRF